MKYCFREGVIEDTKPHINMLLIIYYVFYNSVPLSGIGFLCIMKEDKKQLNLCADFSTIFLGI